MSDRTLAGYLSGDLRYIEKAKEIIASGCRDYPINIYTITFGHLQVGDALLGYALAYDWLHPFMSEGERSTLLQQINDYGAWLREDTEHGGSRGLGSNTGDLIRTRQAHNHGVVVHSGLLLAGMLVDNAEWTRYAKERVKAYFRFSIDETGYGYEGPMYLGYGLHGAIISALAYERATGESLYAESDLEKIPDMILYHLEPQGGELILTNQTAHTMRPGSALFFAINHFKNRVGLWAWNRMLGPDINPQQAHGRGDEQGCTTLPFVILWSDPELEPLDPATADLPLSRKFALGAAFMREGWGPLDSVASFRAAEAIPGIWNQPDGLSFTFHAFGEEFVGEIGPHYYGTEFHNTLTVDDKGQAWKGPGNATLSRITAFTDRGDSVFVVGDATEAYRVSIRNEADTELGVDLVGAQRRLLYVRGQHPCVLIADDVMMRDTAEHSFTSRIITGERIGTTRNTIEIIKPNQRARITGAKRGATCDVFYLSPNDVTLATETITRYEMNALKATVTARSPRFLTLLTASDVDELAPEVSMEGDFTEGIVTIRYADGSTHRFAVSETDLRGTP